MFEFSIENDGPPDEESVKNIIWKMEVDVGGDINLKCRKPNGEWLVVLFISSADGKIYRSYNETDLTNIGIPVDETFRIKLGL